MRTPCRPRWVTLTCLTAVVVAACGSTAAPETAAPTPGHLVTTEEFRPGVEADLLLPDPLPGGPVPVVVLVPGGSWTTADRTGLLPLAEALAADGVVVVTATYRAAGDGVVYPVPAQDVACAVSWAAQRADEEGVTPDPLVVAGHSAGAHLAALAALAPDDYAGDCPAPPSSPTGLVGLAGPYDLTAVEQLAESLIGAPRPEAAQAWREADPLRRAPERPELDVLLLHGEADRTVSPAFTRVFARELRAGGHEVTVEMVAGADHLGLVVAPDVAGPLIARWVDDHAAAPGSPTAGVG